MSLPANPTGSTDEAARAAGRRTAVDSRGRSIELLDHAFVIEGRGARRVRPLTDPSDPSFLELPRIDLDDGRPLRRTAFDIWAGHVQSKLAAGAQWETTYVPRKPYHTGFAILGATLVGASAIWAVVTWAMSDPQVRHQPGLADGMVLLAGLGMLLWIAYVTLSSAARYWLTRLGTYVRLDGRGVTLGKGSPRVPASDVRYAVHHPMLRATHVGLRDGRAFWVPRERGPLVRLDLVLAALPGGPAADV